KVSLRSVCQHDPVFMTLLSTVAYNQKDSLSKIACYQYAINFAKKSKYKKIGLLYCNLAYFYFDRSDYTTAIDNFTKGLQASEKLKHEYGIMLNADGIANVLDMQGNEKATYYKKIALDLAEKLNDLE